MLCGFLKTFLQFKFYFDTNICLVSHLPSVTYIYVQCGDSHCANSLYKKGEFLRTVSKEQLLVFKGRIQLQCKY